jgi:hypothetical protein
MGATVEQDCVESRIGEDNFPLRAHRRITLENRLDILFDELPEHIEFSAFSSQLSVRFSNED